MFGRTARMVRHLEATGVGLPPDHVVVTDAPAPETAEALTAARRGVHDPARALLAATRSAADWDLRHDAVEALAELAADDAAWLEAWLARSPEDPDALAVEARRRLTEAWRVRTAARAKEVAPDRFAAFFALLDDALPVIEAAVAANPGDPVPWSAALIHCMGAQAPRDVFDDCLGQALACAPHHLPTHLHAVQFLAAKWYGSHEEMLAHAAGAAAEAPQDSPVRALEVVAMTEVDLDVDTNGGKAARLDPARVDAITDAALSYSLSRPPEDADARLVRNHLAWALNRQRRWAESLDTYRSIGRYATSSPWQYVGEPLPAFLKLRDTARAGLARSVPRGGSVPAPAVPLPASAEEVAPREIAYVFASPQQVSQELLLTAATVRLVPSGSWTLLESAPSLDEPGRRGRRATLLRLDGMVRIAETAFGTAGLPVLVARVEGPGTATLTLVRQGTATAVHRWAGPGQLPPLETARQQAELFVTATGVGDAGALARLLRDPGAPSGLLVRSLDALGLPPLPAGFGEREEVLAAHPGATVHRARSLWQGVKEFMSDDKDPNPPAPLGDR
ncbi:hypothetical protein [Streptomyces sp. enrichment culture]|uniref:hypothetical protein n=1 Tax=Streptomyces sp. enrichment culture TaxID=1795815 RepID=UPI003F556D2F